MNFDPRRRWVDDLRRLPLRAVLLADGAIADGHDPAKWHTAQGVISVNDTKFFAWRRGCGGGGAIDLAMHLRACNFTDAVQWLSRLIVTSPTESFPSLSPPSPNLRLRLPSADSAQLPHVTRYLREQRALPETFLRPLLDSGHCYADHRANAVFLLLGNDHHPVGAELRGTTATAWRGLAPGSRKDLGYFACGPAHARELVLCESAIDAISCATLHPGRRCLSTAGARPNPAWLPWLLAQHPHIYCGFDADDTGDRMANAMLALHPAIHRLRPPRHDWNDVLTAAT